MGGKQALRNIKLLVQYDGTEYAGWQVQAEGRTVQGTTEEALRKIVPDSSRLIAAGRTDAGVHALRQVACFKAGSRRPPSTIQRALNAILPSDIRIIGADYCDPTFHPRYDAKGKSYTYILHNGAYVAPFSYRYAWHIPQKLNVASMKKSSLHLLGRHDFSSFQAAGCGAKDPVREIFSLHIRKTRSMRFFTFGIEGNFIVITVEGTGFLRHMVRNIVGTLVEVGRGKLREEDVKKILSFKDRTRSGPAAPAKGLFLEKIVYD